MRNKWEYYNVNEERVKEIQDKFNVNKLLATVLSNRDIEPKDVAVYLNPNRHDFHDPFKMPDMEQAVNRILEAIKNNEKNIYLWRL